MPGDFKVTAELPQLFRRRHDVQQAFGDGVRGVAVLPKEVDVATNFCWIRFHFFVDQFAARKRPAVLVECKMIKDLEERRTELGFIFSDDVII